MAGRREAVFATLRAARTALSIVEIAERLAIHPNTARFHLDALVESGRVETVEPDRAKPGRPPLLFRASPGMDPTGRRDYRMLAGILVDAMASQPDPAASATTAGRAWAKAHTGSAAGLNQDQSIDELTKLLAELGFAPERRSSATDAEEIELHNCPFLELATGHREVICPVHLGLMQGAMAAWQAPVTVESLIPFAEPDLCLARLVPAGRSS